MTSGPERGRIWSDNRVHDEDLTLLLDTDGEPVTFARWYLTWLTQAEQRAARADKSSTPIT